MRKWIMGLMAVSLLCLTAGLLYAAYAQAFGEIKSIDLDGGRLVVSVRTGRDTPEKEVTYLIDKDTTVNIGREKKALSDLTEGKRITIVYKEAEKKGGLSTALLINVRGERRRRGGGGGGGN